MDRDNQYSNNYQYYGSNLSFLNKIFFNIQNNSYEIKIMWCLIVTTIILLLSLLLTNANDEEETLRVI
jgi:hypothetical protein